jgi:hypothetical protein
MRRRAEPKRPGESLSPRVGARRGPESSPESLRNQPEGIDLAPERAGLIRDRSERLEIAMMS